MELSFILVPILAFVLLKGYLEQRAAARQDRVRLLERALANPSLDRATIETLTFQLNGVRPARQQGSGRFLAFLLAMGWLTLFSGLGIWMLGHLLEQEGATGAGVMVAVIGFGLVTYPFALRELESRQRT